MSQAALDMSMAGKQYGILPKQLALKNEQGKPQQEAVAISQGARESGLEWLQNDKSELNLSNRVSESNLLLSTSTTDASAKVSRSGNFSQEMLQDLKNKFKKLFISAYSNIFSHNRLLAKISEWMVGNVMERLALLGISPQELEDIKGNVRRELVSQNHVAMDQVVYDETMLEIVT